MKFMLNGTEVELKQFLGVGPLNVLTTRGEVKAQNTDFVVLFGDGASCVLPATTLISIGLDPVAVELAIQADKDADLEIEVENQMRREIASLQTAVLPSGTPVQANRMLEIRKKVAAKLRDEGLIVPNDANDVDAIFDIEGDGTVENEALTGVDDPSPAQLRHAREAEEIAKRIEGSNPPFYPSYSPGKSTPNPIPRPMQASPSRVEDPNSIEGL